MARRRDVLLEHPDAARRALTDAGLEIELDETATIREPEGEATFLWLLARK